MSSIFIQIPCSSANLGPGLDVLAVALNLYLRLNVQYDRNKPFQIELQYLSNHHLHKATTNPSSNLIITTFRHFYPLDCGFLSLTIENEIPLTRGLGSSAAAIVAGVVLANWFGQFHWTRQEMLEKCLCIETHPDNIAASLFGGLVVSCSGTPGT
ncbi:hypothetical protein HMI55_001763 [Coelomomyces lativittatus]|nr:hypothetical protein HMI55_001763 [Coelomomyces lativittatus]